jgi:hypothetical protein
MLAKHSAACIIISAACFPSLKASRQQVLIQFASRWRGVWLQLDARRAHVAAIQGRVFDPKPQPVVMSQGASNFESEIPGVRINKTWRDPTISTMTMNKGQIGDTHIPCLLNDFFKNVGLHYFGGVITVEVNFHFNHLDHALLPVRRAMGIQGPFRAIRAPW